MKLEETLQTLREVDGTTEAGRHDLRAALGRKTGLVVAAAAERVRRDGLEGFEPLLVAAFETLCEAPVRRDPGCRGKLGAVEALDDLAWHDPDVFVAGARLRQPEPSWGPPVDTAGPVRSRSINALVRLGWHGTPALLGDRLADDDANVRGTAARALAAWGQTAGAAALRHKLRIGDEDPLVLVDTLTALIDLDLEAALDIGREWLAGRSVEQRETAAIALGQSRAPEAFEPLVAALEHAVGQEARRVLLVALGTLRLQRSRDFLLAALAGPDGVLAVEALRPHRFEPGFAAEARAAAPESLHARIDEALDDDP